MTTAAPTPYYVILKTPTGLYKWRPALQLVDFVPKGKAKPTWSESLIVEKNNELGALKAAVVHLIIEVY